MEDKMSTTDSISDKIIVLLSGGIDSAVCLAKAYDESRTKEIVAISIDYGQGYSRELDNARSIAKFYGIKHIEINISLGQILEARKIELSQRIKTTEADYNYIPFRNMICFSIACAYAQAHGFVRIFHGGNADDIYPDNKYPFITSFNQTVKEMVSHIRIETPLQDKKKTDIIALGIALKSPLNLTRTCYLNGKKSCGKCQSCKKRLKAFKILGETDPIVYE